MRMCLSVSHLAQLPCAFFRFIPQKNPNEPNYKHVTGESNSLKPMQAGSDIVWYGNLWSVSSRCCVSCDSRWAQIKMCVVKHADSDPTLLSLWISAQPSKQPRAVCGEGEWEDQCHPSSLHEPFFDLIKTCWLKVFGLFLLLLLVVEFGLQWGCMCFYWVTVVALIPRWGINKWRWTVVRAVKKPNHVVSWYCKPIDSELFIVKKASFSSPPKKITKLHF